MRHPQCMRHTCCVWYACYAMLHILLVSPTQTLLSLTQCMHARMPVPCVPCVTCRLCTWCGSAATGLELLPNQLTKQEVYARQRQERDIRWMSGGVGGYDAITAHPHLHLLPKPKPNQARHTLPARPPCCAVPCTRMHTHAHACTRTHTPMPCSAMHMRYQHLNQHTLTHAIPMPTPTFIA